MPAPATADLLRGLPTYSAHVQMELVTPTGAAILRAISPHFGPQPPMRVDHIGYGAGTRTTKDFPNVLRLSIGDAAITTADTAPSHLGSDVVTVLETALDDLSPQLLAHVAEAALAAGALDVMLTPVIMKKGRPGTLLTVLCNPSAAPALEQLLLRETSTLGIRIRQDRRSCLDRTHHTVATRYGDIRIKIGSLAGEALNAAPEFEDCRAAAATSSRRRQAGTAGRHRSLAPAAPTLRKRAGQAMTSSALLKLLAEVERGALTPGAAAERLANLPFEDLGHSRVDHHRSLRIGLPEVVFAAGKNRRASRGHLLLARRRRRRRAGHPRRSRHRPGRARAPSRCRLQPRRAHHCAAASRKPAKQPPQRATLQ